MRHPKFRLLLSGTGGESLVTSSVIALFYTISDDSVEEMTCRMVRITSQMTRICCLCCWILLVVSSTTSIVSGKPTNAQTNIHRHHAANNKAFRGLLFDSYSFSHILFLFYFCFFFFDRIIYYIYNESDQASS